MLFEHRQILQMQHHEVRIAVHDTYDDGGYSGGDRPALKHLMTGERIRDKIATSKAKGL